MVSPSTKFEANVPAVTVKITSWFALAGAAPEKETAPEVVPSTMKFPATILLGWSGSLKVSLNSVALSNCRPVTTGAFSSKRIFVIFILVIRKVQTL